ncbi:signal peptide peptidase SppA [Kaistia soli DSM 19436]|uniref:Signal peptide peptidase SppA n=1 Tax=Kaistia soli DSM 19436 TaxID=1122133 RepID=A0A1M4Y8X9_9HYPH|nr:S49 family peptidase [Kaistia soli]SHF02195.1 signal peptide peptidase SppA [Kaistia soli DSM 19436]
MRYAHILLAVTEERWAIREEKLQAILDFLALQAAGGKLSAEEIEARVTKQTERDVARQQGSVAILPLRGVIANRMSMMDDISGGTSSEGFGRLFQAAVRDGSTKAIVIDVDSPGGAVSGSDELASLIYSARGQKPIIAHVNATAASAAYWIASAADEVVVTPSGSVGSIGVFGVHNDVSGALTAQGVKKTLVSAGKFKTAGNPYEPLDEETRARMQARVDTAYEMFVRTVARNRGVALNSVRNGFGQGDMVDAEPAVAEGMADRVGTLEETLQRFGASLYAPVAKRKAFAPQRERRALDL